MRLRKDGQPDRRIKGQESEKRKASTAHFVETYSKVNCHFAKVSDDEIASVLIETGGCVNRAAKMLKYHTPYLGTRIKNSPMLTQVLSDARATTVHAVSDALIAAALKVDQDPRFFQAAKFVLELYGKPHGIVVSGDVKVEHTGTVTQKVDSEQVEAFKTALERAVLAQKRAEGEIIDVE